MKTGYIKVLGLMCLVSLICGPTRIANAELTFSDPVNISQSPLTFSGVDASGGNVFGYSFKTSGTSIYAVWFETHQLYGVSDLYFARSTDEGATWSAPINISNAPQTVEQRPQLTVVGPHVYILWSDSTLGYLFAYSHDGGQTFSPATIIVPSTESYWPPYPAMAANETGIYMVWSSYPYNGVLKTIRSVNGGATFTPPSTITGATCCSTSELSMVANGQELHLFEIKYQGIHYTRSMDGGQTFEPFRNLHNTYKTLAVTEARLSGSGVYLSYLQGGNADGTMDVLFLRSTDNGNTFSPPATISQAYRVGCSQQHPFEINGPHLYISWAHYDQTNPDGTCARRMLAHSTDGGGTWLPLIVLPGIPPDTYPDTDGWNIAPLNARVYVAWDRAGSPGGWTRKVFFSESPDYGATFSAPMNISQPLEPSSEVLAVAAILRTENKVHVIIRKVSPSMGGGPIDLYIRSASTVDAEGTAPAVVAQAASAISQTSATLNSSITPNSPNANTTTGWFEWGATTAYGSVAPAQPLGSGTAAVAISQVLTGLTPNTTYHFRAVGQNETDTVYGSDLSLTTPAQPPVVSTGSATNIGPTTATLNGTANPNGVSGITWFEWGLTTSYGNTAPIPPQAISGSVANVVSAGIIGLGMNTLYHYRVVAENNGGRNYGADATFTTLGQQDRLPTSDRNVANAWSLVGCGGGGRGGGGGGNGNAYQCVDDPIGSPNDGTDYIRVQNNGKEAIFGFSAFAVPAGATINYVRVTYVAIANGGSANIKAALRINSSVYTQPTAQDLSATWASYRYDWTRNPRTGLPWTVSEVNGSGFQGMGVYSGSGNESVTQVYVTVGYQ